ncbi:MAG: hypothetical protein NTX98_03900 [Candidatus Doudnabacteria bacterium]|nr:hypothetical protein [Candidatus Doudnabacteria bacterium]
MAEHRTRKRSSGKLPKGKRKLHKGKKHRGAGPGTKERERQSIVDFAVSMVQGTW